MKILGVTFEKTTVEDVLAAVPKEVEKGNLQHVVTINPEFLVEAQGNGKFLEVLKKADWRLVDGVGVFFAALIQGQKLTRGSGVDLVLKVCAKAPTMGWRIFLLGGGESVADLASQRLRERFKLLQVMSFRGSRNISSETEEERRQAVEMINEFKPHFLFVAYGSPIQDLWIARNRSALSVGLAVGVGGSFDYLVGKIYRAPRWVRAIGLEWLVRFILQPRKRGKRIFKAAVVFPYLVLKELMTGAKGNRGR